MRNFSQTATSEKVASQLAENEFSIAKGIYVFVMGVTLFLFATSQM